MVTSPAAQKAFDMNQENASFATCMAAQAGPEYAAGTAVDRGGCDVRDG